MKKLLSQVNIVTAIQRNIFLCNVISAAGLNHYGELIKRPTRFLQHPDVSCYKVFFPASQGAKGNSRHSDRNIRGTCTIVFHRQNWDAQFKSDDFSTCVAPRPTRPKTMTTPYSIDQIHDLILEDRRISAKSVADQLAITRGRVGSIIHEDLYMLKLSAKWDPKCWNADEKVVWANFGIFSARSK